MRIATIRAPVNGGAKWLMITRTAAKQPIPEGPENGRFPLLAADKVVRGFFMNLPI